MHGKKLLLASLLNSFDLLRMFISSRKLFVLGYHRVAKDQKQIDLSPFDGGVFGCTAREFADHVDWLRANTRVLSLGQVLELLAGADLGKGPFSLITFDDGYRDNYTVAYPILKDRGLPAVIFAASKLIDDRRLGWWDLLAYIFKKTNVFNFIWEGRVFYPAKEYDVTLGFFLERMKLAPTESTRDLVERLAELCRVELPPQEMQNAELMTWEQLREVSGNGLEVASHTHSHRVLATLTKDEQERELRLSKQIIGENLERPVRALAYPVGGLRHFTKQTMELAENCGYEAAFSYGTGFCDLGNLSAFAMERFEPARARNLLAAQMAMPRVMFA